MLLSAAPRLFNVGRVLGRSSAKAGRIRARPDATEVQSIGVPARHDGWIGLGHAVRMSAACLEQQGECCSIELKPTPAVQPDGVVRGAIPVSFVSVFVTTLGIMEERE